MNDWSNLADKPFSIYEDVPITIGSTTKFKMFGPNTVTLGVTECCGGYFLSDTIVFDTAQDGFQFGTIERIYADRQLIWYGVVQRFKYSTVYRLVSESEVLGHYLDWEE